ncbi:hypothetical protein EC991_002771 [Linnemannia zychae]|nr:hypothetical protein EC991_002771 [Linnemannia zychae]
MYTTNNFRYLRISKHSVLPLNLLLSKDDLTWFNDYSFQEILTVLKPLLLGRVELFNQGHVIKRTINPIATYSSAHSEDGLEDAGVIFGGEQADGSSTKLLTKRRNAAAERPQFSVRFGLRTHTPSERGGAVLIANKNLGFAKVKTEEDNVFGNELGQGDSSGNQRSSSRRTSMGLASLEGEPPTGEGGSVVIREEDDSENLRVSHFQREDDMGQDAEDGEGEYQDESASQRRGAPSKRKGSGSTTHNRRRGKRAKATDGSHQPPSQSDQKPTLEVSYGAMKLHPQTLYIVIRSVDSELPSLSSILPFTAVVESTSTADKSELTAAAAAKTTETASTAQEEDEESLFPPGLDYFIDS